MARKFYKYPTVTQDHIDHLDQHNQQTARPRYKPDNSKAIVSTPSECAGCLALEGVVETTKSGAIDFVMAEEFDGDVEV